DGVAGRQRGFQSDEAFLDGPHDFDGVRARLPPDLEQHGPRAVDVRQRFGLRFAVFDPRHVADSNRMSILLTDDDLAELRHALDAAARAQGDRLRPLIDAAPADLDVLALQRRAASVTVRLEAASHAAVGQGVDWRCRA